MSLRAQRSNLPRRGLRLLRRCAPRNDIIGFILLHALKDHQLSFISWRAHTWLTLEFRGRLESAGQSQQRVADARAVQERNSKPS